MNILWKIAETIRNRKKTFFVQFVNSFAALVRTCGKLCSCWSADARIAKAAEERAATGEQPASCKCVVLWLLCGSRSRCPSRLGAALRREIPGAIVRRLLLAVVLQMFVAKLCNIFCYFCYNRRAIADFVIQARQRWTSILRSALNHKRKTTKVEKGLAARAGAVFRSAHVEMVGDSRPLRNVRPSDGLYTSSNVTSFFSLIQIWACQKSPKTSWKKSAKNELKNL